MDDLILRCRAAVGGMHALFLAISLVVLGGAGLLAGSVATAQDPIKVDAKHYKVGSRMTGCGYCVLLTALTRSQ
jgi:hypothetical protein